MKLGKSAQDYALGLTKETCACMVDEIATWSPVLLDAYEKVLRLGDTSALSLLATMCIESLDFSEQIAFNEVINDANPATYFQNQIVYETMNKVDEGLDS